MPTQESAASIQGVGLRVTRLDANGNLLNGPGDSYTTAAFMRVSFTPEYEDGDEITEKGASGSVCVSYKSPDTLKRVTMELAICEPDPEFTSLVSGGVLLRKNLGTFASQNNKSIGWAAPAVGDDPSGNGVAIEVWSRAIKEGKRAAVLPFFKWVFPYAKLRQSGDRVIENGLLANTFEGYGLGNLAFATGMDGRWEYPTITDRPYAWARAAWAPSGLNGFYTWHGDLVAAVNNKALTSNVATLTTTNPHNFAVGESVTVTGTGVPFDGVKVITAVPSAATFTFAATSANVTSVVVGPVGGAVVTAGSRAVLDLAEAGSLVDINIPGNINYTADAGTDFTIQSNLDPLA